MSQSSSSDSTFVKMFALVIGALVLFTVIIMTMANMVGDNQDKPMDEITRSVLTKRVAPAGAVRTGDSADEEVVAAAPKSPEELYGICAACHDTGAADAPLKSDAASWEARIAAEGGIEGLIKSAIAGKGGMPARGGSAYSDDEMAAVVKFLVGQ